MNKLINRLIKDGYLKSDSVINAFSRINRIEFIPKDVELQANVDIALPIGYGQTVSQPLTVAFMLELLEPKAGHKILDVGSGSGWTTSLLSEIVGDSGKVIAVERIKELSEFGKKNIEKFNFIKRGIAEVYCTDGSLGYPEKAPYDRILVSASCPYIPESLKNQLKIGGKMVLPVGNSILYLEKKSDNEFYKEEYFGFSFVPLITKE